MRRAMTRRILGAALFAAFSTPVLSQAPAPTVPMPKEDLVPVAIDTSLGRIVVALDRDRAPGTTPIFLHYADPPGFEGQTFSRSMKGDALGGLIRGGAPPDARKLFPPIAHEPTSKTGLKN